jgi:spore coat polysaccharide biosynthesis protein SpsF (cytidylyltransferase family)
MSNKKQTAVEWLLDRIEDVDLTEKLWENVKQQAKEMENEQIENAFEESRLTYPMIGFKHQRFEQYYNETYGAKK